MVKVEEVLVKGAMYLVMHGKVRMKLVVEEGGGRQCLHPHQEGSGGGQNS